MCLSSFPAATLAAPTVVPTLGPLTLAQDTTPRARRKKPALKRGERVRRQPPRDTARVAGDTLAGDSLAEVGAPFPEPDSIMQALMQLPGYQPVIYRGDTLNFSTQDRAIQILQRANVDRAGEKISADTITYEGTTRWVTASGNVELVNAKGEEVVSDQGPLYYDTERRIGTVVNAQTQWEIWKVAGDFTLEGSDTLWVRNGHFTSCDLPEPHYRFESDKIKLVLGHIVVAWPVRLYFGDVPVFWFPFMAQDIRRGRHSGMLTLRFGVNDIVRNSSGRNRHISNIGYYWAISDYMDAQLSLDWWSNTWTRLDGFFRYRWRQRFIDGRLGYSQFFLPNGGRELSATWVHAQKFGERSDLRASVRFVSSQQFQREAEFNPERLVQTIRSNVGFTRRFDWGMLNLSAQRLQPISEGEPTTTSLPQFSLTLSPIVITPAPSPLEARWYHGLTWTGSTNFNRVATETPGQPDRETLTGGLTSNLALGNLRLSSAASFQEQVIDTPDTVVVSPDGTTGDTLSSVTVFLGPQIRQGTVSWQTSLGYQQRLIGSTTLTPAVNVSGSLFRSNRTDLSFVSAPTRLSFSASLNSDVYGFFPGIGSLERIRHKFSPRFNWSYSPAVAPNPELQNLPGFAGASASEQRHQLSISLAQTFEGKFKPRKELSDEEAGADTTKGRQPPKARKLTLLAIRTSAITYDFVRKEVTTDRLSNTLTSDLLRGLTVRIDHDLFDERPAGRVFDPFLSQLNLTFSLGDRAVAALFGAGSAGIGRGRGILPEARGFDEEELSADTLGGPAGEGAGPGAGEPGRPWTVSVDYSLVRSRPIAGQEPRSDRQSLRANFRFSPTKNWTLAWRTQYDLERGEFVDHMLILRRDLHRWSATFEFVQASNGNFVFNFRVNLNDLPDVKFDYRQESR